MFMIGPLDQGWWPDGLYTAPTDEAIRYDIEILKKLGFNMLRKHVKVEPDRWYYWCDKLGLHGLAGHAQRHDRRGQNRRAQAGSPDDAVFPPADAADFERGIARDGAQSGKRSQHRRLGPFQ